MEATEDRYEELLMRLVAIYAGIGSVLFQLPIPIDLPRMPFDLNEDAILASVYDACDMVEIEPIGDELTEAILGLLHLWAVAFGLATAFRRRPTEHRFVSADLLIGYADEAHILAASELAAEVEREANE